MAGRVPLPAVVVLVIAPGLAIGLFGLRAVAEREQSLRTNYTATTVLVRDRLAAELASLESSAPDPATQQELAALAAAHSWLELPFVLRADGSVMTANLHAGTPPPADILAALPGVAAAVFVAEQQEFARGDLSAALSAYELALARIPSRDAAARAFVLTRIGRTLFKLRRYAEGAVRYEAAAAAAGAAVDRHGLPYAAIALLQIIDGAAAQGRPDEQVAAGQRFARYVLDHPWDLDHGYRQHLLRVAAGLQPDDAGGRRAAATLTREAAAIEQVRTKIYPQLRSDLVAPEPRGREVRHIPVPGEPSVLIGYRALPARAGGQAMLGYRVRLAHIGGPVLARVLETVDLGRDLRVALTMPDAPADATAAGAAAPLVQAELLPGLEQWQVALFDTRGRSISQLVARERWTYGALVAGMLAVMTVGVVLTLRASARAAELARARSDFVANVSHELKTPLALIRMFGETLESGIVADPARRQEFYGIIRRESERLTHLIDNVLDLGRIDQGTKHYDIRPRDLIETVRAAIEAYRPLFDRLDFTVDTDFPQSPVAAPFDRDAIIQSLVNLFQNAIKYAGGTRHLAVSIRRDESTVSIAVADRGVGIAADQIDRIFERYYRVAATGESRPAGSGLGLTIVKHAIDAHGGRVTVQSSPGEGTIVTLILPAEGGQAAPLHVPASAGPVSA